MTQCSSFLARIGPDSYPVYISQDSDEALISFLSAYSSCSVLIIADSCFKDNSLLPSKKYQDILSSYPTHFLAGGIESKSLAVLESVFDALFSHQIPRDGLIVCLGGGVVGDVAAMAASIYQRGIKLVHIPTTSTSMFDSSVGGKTAVNHLGQVNLLGTYYNPVALFCDTRFLVTLHPRDLYSGLCESIKKAFISDKNTVQYFFDHYDDINSFSEYHLHYLATWSIKTKLSFVCSDFKESSSRLFLNYGHTFGQALESYFGLYQPFLRHGEAVSLGMCCASQLSSSLYNSLDLYSRQRNLLELYNLPCSLSNISVPSLPSSVELFHLIKNDKKRLSSGNRFIVVSDFGVPHIVDAPDTSLLLQAFEAIL